jgi:alpha-ketoglutaric semialdehyde dehydrogenase
MLEIESVMMACQRASDAAPFMRAMKPSEIASMLELIASKLSAREADIVRLASLESNLPIARLTGELGRTTGQLKLFASDVRDGRWVDRRIVGALPDRQPLPRPSLERSMIPIGPVAVFGASNFPLAFSVAGGDTASALAAGCPVIAKVHPAHPKTSELVGSIVSEAVSELGLPLGVFQIVSGSNEVGAALVTDHRIKGVGFTGSKGVGRLLMDLSAARAEPIPVFAEMGSINPVFILPGALTERVDALAAGYVQSLTVGVGQFCTNPGVVFGIDSPDWTAFCEAVQVGVSAVAGGTMLTPGIGASYCANTGIVSASPGVESLVKPCEAGQPGLAKTSLANFLEYPELREEVFGPFGILVTATSFEELTWLFPVLEGQLTGTIQYGSSDEAMVKELVPLLEERVGRLVFNGFPTGVEVCEGMQHGGPFPASSDVRFTSVGNHAILRWLRPVTYQNSPEFMRA